MRALLGNNCLACCFCTVAVRATSVGIFSVRHRRGQSSNIRKVVALLTGIFCDLFFFTFRYITLRGYVEVIFVTCVYL